MARPSKTTVEYFSHDCEHGKTMFILEQKYKNDGYAFWFKLLEQLGSAPGHVIDTKTQAMLEYLSAKAGLSPDKCTEILDLLAGLDAIDRELWAGRVVWCQKFVDRLEPVYLKRHTKKPDKPDNLSVNPPLAVVIGETTPQSKVKDIKEKEIKEKKRKEFEPPTVQQVSDYCLERKNGIDPERFIAHYETTGWLRKGQKIKNWRACVITWEKNGYEKTPQQQKTGTFDRELALKNLQGGCDAGQKVI